MNEDRWRSIITPHVRSYQDLASSVMPLLGKEMPVIAEVLVQGLRSGRKVMLCGNGGSAADCQHIAAELTGRYRHSGRTPLPAIALTTDSSALTAIGNDFGFDEIFARQVEALAQSGDILLAISTSGNSRNVIRACAAARKRDCKVIALLGGSGGELAALADFRIVVPSSDTPRIQEVHALIGHLLCECVDNAFGPSHARD